MNKENEHNNSNRINKYCLLTVSDFLLKLSLPSVGLNKKDVEQSRNLYGSNSTIKNKKNSIFSIFLRSFFTPFSIVLFILGLISLFTEILFPESEHSSYSTVIIILSMVFLSGIVRFTQELRSKKVTDSINKYINTKINVFRYGKWYEVDSEDVVVGDCVKLKSGDRVPADIRLIKAKNCYTSQSVITGESKLCKKNIEKLSKLQSNISEYTNTIFSGTTIASGECEGIVLNVGKDSVYGQVS